MWGSWGTHTHTHTQQHPRQAPAPVLALPGHKVALTQGFPSAFMQNGMENSPQTLQNTNLAQSAQVHTPDVGVKAINFAVNYGYFPIKEKQTGPKPQSYEKEGTIIQNIQAFP